MNRILLVFLVLVCVFSIASSQEGSKSSVNRYSLMNAAADTAGNDVVDTTGTFDIGPWPYMSLSFVAVDRFSVKSIAFDYRARGATAWTTVANDTIAAFSSSSDGATTYNEKIVRDAVTNKIPMIWGQARIRTTFAASGNDGGKRVYLYLNYGR